MDRRKWLGQAGVSLLAGACCGGTAFAQTGAAPTRKLVLMSLIGDELTTVAERPGASAGSDAEQTNRSTLPLQPGALDNSVARLLQLAVKQRDPKAGITLVAPTEASLFKGHDDWLPDTTAKLPVDVLNDLRATGATQLLLLAKHRADGALQVNGVQVRSGPLEGLGYYVNLSVEIRNPKTLITTQGFLAPYAYLQLALVDLASSRIVGQQRLLATRVMTDGLETGDVKPWQVVPDHRKLGVLLDLVHSEIDRAVPALLPAGSL